MYLRASFPPPSLTYALYSPSDRVSIYLSDKEPTEDSLSFLSVPYARSVPNDDPILPLPLAELVRHDVFVVVSGGPTKPRGGPIWLHF